MTVHVCFSNIDERKLEVLDCPTCDSKQEFYCWHQEWYGWHVTCLNCGDSWEDGERMERPFSRGWRKREIEHVEKQVAKYNLRK